MTIDFVPPDFDVPTSYTSDHFYLGILDPSVVELDYDAVMSSKVNLRQIFSENHEWPRDTMTLEDNNGDLLKHREEFDLRKAFAYTVLTTDKTKCIGCLYIDPSRVSDFDSEVYFWIRDDSLHIETEFYTNIQNWLEEAWPFKKIAWPGRQISWQQWGSPVGIAL
ncbi:hypothetical protein [Kiloniella sp.]|uniref:hypothetical protein n=1 Tax=Kiloniella sp. TaxID=1938587 RepID=UPI003B0277AD